MSHFINKCSCGKIISSCRCFSEKKIINIVDNGCNDCKQNKEASIEELKKSLEQIFLQIGEKPDEDKKENKDVKVEERKKLQVAKRRL